jgi:hypothetical protein
MKIREVADPQTLSRLHRGEEKIGTAHRTLHITERRKFFSPQETAQRKSAKNPPHHVLQNLTTIIKFYTSLQNNLPLLSPKDIITISEQLAKLSHLLAKCLPRM